MARLKETIEIEPGEALREMRFRPQVWKAFFDILSKCMYNTAEALVPIHTSDERNTYMVKLSDDAKEILIIEDRGRHERDQLCRQRDLWEDEAAKHSQGENPRLVNRESRHYDRMKEESEKHAIKLSEINAIITDLTKRIAGKQGIVRYSVKIEQFMKGSVEIKCVPTKEHEVYV